MPIFTLDEARNQKFSRALAEAVLLEVEPPVIDMGCALGRYARFWEDAGLTVCAVEATKGIEGVSVFRPIIEYNLTTPGFKISRGIERVNPGPAVRRASASVVCLEVGEHIEPEYADIFLDNICRYARQLILSWAIPGQGGLGHVNERCNEWVRERVELRGLKFDAECTGRLRRAMEHDLLLYFRDTLMVFGK